MKPVGGHAPKINFHGQGKRRNGYTTPTTEGLATKRRRRNQLAKASRRANR